MSEWKEVKLGEIARSNQSTYSPKGNWKFANYLDTGNITENRISEIQFIDLAKEGLPSRARRKVRKNSIIYSTVRPNQKHFGIIKNIPENFLVSTGFSVLDVDESKANPDFVYYSLIQEKNTASLQAVAEQSTSAYPAIKSSDIENLPIKLPPLAEQKRIAEILGSLDDKIELNNRINRNLEEQAQALFKNWFVDFAPFGGNMPAGWKRGKLSDIAEFEKEKIEVSRLTEFSYYSTENMLPDKAGVCPASSLPNVSQTTCCYPGETIISNIRPYFKKVYFCTEELAGCSTDVLCFKPRKASLAIYNYFLLCQDDFFNYVLNGAKGTKMPRGDKSQMMKFTVCIPPEEVLQKFAAMVAPMLQKVDGNRNENRCLAVLRNALLPKLVNGTA